LIRKINRARRANLVNILISLLTR